MKISEETLKNISQLSKLGIHDDTKEKLIEELESILEMVNKMLKHFFCHLKIRYYSIF